MKSKERSNTLVAAFGAALLFNSTTTEASPAKGLKIVEDMVAVVGAMDKLKSLKDVEYTYTYQLPNGEKDVSTERYVFEGEKSWAEYKQHDAVQMPDVKGVIVQGFDGKSSWITVASERLTDPKAVKRADFSRKTNFYWFTMMPKLLDPGINYAFEGTTERNGNIYDKVRVTFDASVGDVQDTYLLFVNQKTKLVDEFLFTVLDFGRKDPLLMKVSYQNVQGIMVPTDREYTPSNWKGEVKPDAAWTKEISRDVKFDLGVSKDIFTAPAGKS